MSLACANCRTVVAKGDVLPGREATLVHPNILGLVYVPDSSSQTGIKYEFSYVQSPDHLALCFKCIEDKLPESQKPQLNKVYQSYEAEMAYADMREREKGKWVSSSNGQSLELVRRFGELRELLPETCLFTEKAIRDGSPFFTAYPINRVTSSSSPVFGGSYQISGRLDRSSSKFYFSFDAFRGAFPDLFDELSCSMRGVKNPNWKKTPDEITMSSEFRRAVEKQTGKPIDEIIAKMLEGTDNLRIIYPID